MFPEIMRDEVFRLETPRSWLRWPIPADADAVAAIMAQGGEDGSAGLTIVPHAAALCLIDRWRADNEAGHALRLLIVLKDETRPVGSIGIAPGPDGEPNLSFALRPGEMPRKILVEATDALVNAAFLFGGVDELAARPTSADLKARKILKRVGFAYAGALFGYAAEEAAPLRERFTLDRAAWLAGGTLQPGRFAPIGLRYGLGEAV